MTFNNRQSTKGEKKNCCAAMLHYANTNEPPAMRIVRMNCLPEPVYPKSNNTIN